MRIPIAFALLTLMALLAPAQEDPSALRDELREIARPEKTERVPKAPSQKPTPATQPKQTSIRANSAAQKVRAREVRPILPLAGTYRGEIEVANVGQRPVRCAAQLRFDPKLNRGVISIDYPTAQLVRTINGKLQDNVFRGRSEGGFSGIVYSYAANFILTFARDHRMVWIRETPVHPPPGYADDGQATTLLRSN